MQCFHRMTGVAEKLCAMSLAAVWGVVHNFAATSTPTANGGPGLTIRLAQSHTSYHIMMIGNWSISPAWAGLPTEGPIS